VGRRRFFVWRMDLGSGVGRSSAIRYRPQERDVLAELRRKVLVCGDDNRSFLATVRALGRMGYDVQVAPFDFTALALRSRYINKIHWLPYYLEDGQVWLKAVEDLFRREMFDLVIPCDERWAIPLQHHGDVLGPLCPLASADGRAGEVLNDKHLTRELARELGIPVAAGRLIREDETAQSILAECPTPLALKPRQSYTPTQLYSRAKVAIAVDAEELAELLPKYRSSAYLFEAYFAGSGVGLSLLAHQGKVLQAFEHHRVREDSSGGYYRVSAAIDPALLAAASAVAQALAYTGVAMFEFKVNHQTGQWILLEVNARPWGSMPLPLSCGVDFAGRWAQLLIEGRETPNLDYPIGIYGRNLIPDLHQIISRAGALRRQPVALVTYLAEVVWEFSRLATGREHWDALVRDDPAPGLAEFAGIGRSILRRLSSLLPGEEQRARRREREHFDQLVRRRGTSTLSIVFVCQGNICRSPLGGLLLTKLLEGLPVRVASAGMLPRMHNPSPANGVTAARELGIDLSSHRSAHLAPFLAEQATVLVVFDEKNRASILQRYPALAPRILFLGSFLEDLDWPSEIADPDGFDLLRFREIYAHIDRASIALAQRIRSLLH